MGPARHVRGEGTLTEDTYRYTGAYGAWSRKTARSFEIVWTGDFPWTPMTCTAPTGDDDTFECAAADAGDKLEIQYRR